MWLDIWVMPQIDISKLLINIWISVDIKDTITLKNNFELMNNLTFE